MQPIKKIIFVYNANSGKVNLYLDILHKIASPSTYPCSLCDLTHGVFKERETWKAFRESSKIDMVFYHKDEFKQEFGSKFLAKFTYPLILEVVQDDFEVLISDKELNALEDLDQLIALFKKRTKHL